MAYSPGQRLLKLTGAREPEHRLDPPVPVVARIVWEHDGEEHIETEAAGWSGQLVYVRVPDTRYRLTSVWLNTADVRRRALRVRRERPAPLAGAGRLCCAADLFVVVEFAVVLTDRVTDAARHGRCRRSTGQTPVA
jgi:hypothetical protein